MLKIKCKTSTYC